MNPSRQEFCNNAYGTDDVVFCARMRNFSPSSSSPTTPESWRCLNGRNISRRVVAGSAIACTLAPKSEPNTANLSPNCTLTSGSSSRKSNNVPSSVISIVKFPPPFLLRCAQMHPHTDGHHRLTSPLREALVSSCQRLFWPSRLPLAWRSSVSGRKTRRPQARARATHRTIRPERYRSPRPGGVTARD